MVAPLSGKELALKDVDKLSQLIHDSSAHPAFTNLASAGHRRKLIDSLRARVQEPFLVNQAGASLCGPASFFYCLIQDAPRKYVKMVRDLYLNGQTNIGLLKIIPSGRCKSVSALQGMNIVDWIALASLRDSENKLFRFDQASNSARGITWPQELAKWFRLAGYQKVTNQARLYPCHVMEHFNQASALANKKYRVCLFVDGSSDERPFPIKNIANHWVVQNLGTHFTHVNDVPSIPVFSWGDDAYNLNHRQQNWQKFGKRYFGYVAAQGLELNNL